MRVLILVRPKHFVPLSEMPALTEATVAWRDRYREHFESFDFFVGGGGCGIVNFPEELALNLFYWSSRSASSAIRTC
jgi:hypothetical protein